MEADSHTRAANLTERLKEKAPCPGYKGHCPHFRSGFGERFNDAYLTAQSFRPNPERVANDRPAAWTTPGCVRAASHIVMNGKGTRQDLQVLYSAEERGHGVASSLHHRAQSASAMDKRLSRRSDPTIHRADFRKSGYMPPEGNERIDPVTMVRAGEPTISQKLDGLRENEYKKVRHRDKDDRINAYTRCHHLRVF
eukprot:gnl/MRDRNA2_/MRDRNA2_115223_c0_seq1.p1 gnl/MRDRNA2_/MRDRNA2_115223_c0~~gnl/MRDRNA2_/MRDRNA2_115223_c0_seq1.p1  ORF type:complete len:218 (+),score=22.66 gnl/MRDRNA2_/MRDRNA2_115223_c0_seq1:69-656(+)